MMESLNRFSTQVYLVAVPIIAILLIAEFVYLYRQQDSPKDLIKDGITSTITGMVYLVLSMVFKKTIMLGLMFWVYRHFHWLNISVTSPWSWIILVFLDDFVFYVGHSLGHYTQYFWASHSVHHSSEHYNLSKALRKPWTYDISGLNFIWLILVVIGFNPLQVLIVKSLNFLYQFWVHTETIKKMPRWFEAIFVTPSHHRVHHASNAQYIDKNLGGVFIIWDKLWGTFEPEVQKPIYGLTKNIGTYNLFWVEFNEWKNLIQRIIQHKNIKFLFKNPGWTPHDK